MLTQVEADALIAMKKRFLNPRPLVISPGTDETHELIGENQREQFLFDIWRGMLRLSKYTLQTRGQKTVVLVRLDIGGSPHTNPDGEKIDGTHIHIYREGYGDKWAQALDPKDFGNSFELWTMMEYFCRRSNIEGIPPLQGAFI